MSRGRPARPGSGGSQPRGSRSGGGQSRSGQSRGAQGRGDQPRGDHHSPRSGRPLGAGRPQSSGRHQDSRRPSRPDQRDHRPWERRPAALATRPDPSETRLIELTYLPGMAPFVLAELDQVVPDWARARVPERDDAIQVRIPDSVPGALIPVELAKLVKLRTVVAPYLVLNFPGRRPNALASDPFLSKISRALLFARAFNPLAMDELPPEMQVDRDTFRLDAAGADSPQLTRLTSNIAKATELRHTEDGAWQLRLRRGLFGQQAWASQQGDDGDPGWQLLIRFVGRPLAARPWRVRDYPGALNGTIAAAAVQLAEIAATDRVVNLMSGSATLAIEAALGGPVRTVTAVDRLAEATAAGVANATAAGVHRKVKQHTGEIADGEWRGDHAFQVLLADPPWGDLIGDRSAALTAHEDLLRVATEVAAPGARLVVVTHEIKAFQDLIAAQDHWELVSQHSVFAKGHHPRIFLLHAPTPGTD